MEILYIGGSYPQKCIIESLTKAGHIVTVTDATRNPPSAVFASDFLQINAIDTISLLKTAREIYGKQGDLLTYGVADYACASCAIINQQLKIDHQSPSAIRTMIDKNRSRVLLKAANLPVPEVIWSGKSNEFSIPLANSIIARHPHIMDVIVKPNKSSASSGVIKCILHDRQKLISAVKSALKFGNEVSIEQYVSGEIWNMDLLVADGETHLISLTRRIDHESLDFLPSAQIQIPLREIDNISKYTELARCIAKALNYDAGPMTVDFVMSARGPIILEASPHFHMAGMEILRGNGNPMLAWVEYMSGNCKWAEHINAVNDKAGLLMMIRANTTGILRDIKQEASLQSNAFLVDYIRLKKNGTKIDALDARASLLSLAWLTARTSDELTAFVRQQNDVLVPQMI